MTLKAYLAARQKAVDRALDRFLPKQNVSPATIHQAMRYSLFAGGKRLRPILCLAAAEACGGKISDALPLASAMECIHTYSLVHDDLPSMDNDDFRRGRATCHKVFGEGIAILAGDGLLTIAFEIAARAKPIRRYSMTQIIREIASAAGSRKLIAGQVADLEAEGQPANRSLIRYIHENKTAAMLTTSVRLGAMSADAEGKKLIAMTKFGRSQSGKREIRINFFGQVGDVSRSQSLHCRECNHCRVIRTEPWFGNNQLDAFSIARGSQILAQGLVTADTAAQGQSV